ncbi:hypothetical protein FHR92_004189 [Fontibacillus solani]|uniref:Spore coat protein D n=2 Tax=Fontibacillus TaxID=995014 RepID=A0A1G7HRM7_9BACL|nr:hypothetical protein [Fontibacillus solani]SDF03100.1 hypothetical protein SAMN04488542_10510 [Fontibacillus panacisegetis]
MAFCPTCPEQEIVDPPQTFYENYYHPQVVNVIHPIEIIKQHHCVPVPNHIYKYCVKDVMCHVSSVKKRKKRK